MAQDPEKTDLTVRPAGLDDTRRILEIRNHPANLPFFNNPKPVPFEDHKRWYENQYFGSKHNFCFLLDTNGVSIGYSRFDREETGERYVVSIALDPDYQGRGMGFFLLSESLKLLPPPTTILAQIHKNNPASLRLFRKAGFSDERENEQNYYLILSKS